MYGPDLGEQELALREVAEKKVNKSYRWVYNEPAGGSNFDREGRDCLKTETITTHSGYVASVRTNYTPNHECCQEFFYHKRPEEGYMRKACKQEAKHATFNRETDQCTQWWDIYYSTTENVSKNEPRPADKEVCCSHHSKLISGCLL